MLAIRDDWLVRLGERNVVEALLRIAPALVLSRLFAPGGKTSQTCRSPVTRLKAKQSGGQSTGLHWLTAVMMSKLRRTALARSANSFIQMEDRSRSASCGAVCSCRFEIQMATLWCGGVPRLTLRRLSAPRLSQQAPDHKRDNDQPDLVVLGGLFHRPVALTVAMIIFRV